MVATAKEMDFTEVVGAVAKEISPELLRMIDTPEGRGMIARFVNEEVEKVRTKLDSDIADERKLRTASEEAAAVLIAKMERRMAYNAESQFHVGEDGRTVKPSVSRESADYLRKYVRALRDKDNAVLSEMRAVSSAPGDGGNFIQTEVANEVLRLVPTTGIYPQITRNWPMGTSQINIGAVVGQMSDYWPDENTPLTPSFPGFDKLILAAKQHGAFIPIPLSLIEDAVIDFGQLIADLIRECLAKGTDRVGIIGKSVADGGADPFTGLLYTPNINVLVQDDGDTSMATTNFDYALGLQTKVPDGARDGCSYILSPTYFDWLRTQKDSHGDYIYQKPGDAGIPGTLWNRPYHLTERMPVFTKASQPSTRTLLYGNWAKWAFWGNRKVLSLATSDTAGDTFINVQLAVRGITREGFASFGPALAVLETAPR